MSGRRTTLFGVVGVLVGATIVYFQYGSDGRWLFRERSSMQFDSTEHDWGTIRDPKPKTLEHRFTLRNIGRIPIVIQQVSTSCGCTVAEVPTHAIAPGASATIEARMTLKSSGVNRNRIVVVSNAGRSLLTLGATYEPMSVVNVVPPVIEIGALRESTTGHDAAADVHVFTTASTPVDIKAAVAAAGHVRVDCTVAQRTRVASSAGYFRTSFELRMWVTSRSLTAWEDELTVSFTDGQVLPVKIPVRFGSGIVTARPAGAAVVR